MTLASESTMDSFGIPSISGDGVAGGMDDYYWYYWYSFSCALALEEQQRYEAVRLDWLEG